MRDEDFEKLGDNNDVQTYLKAVATMNKLADDNYVVKHRGAKEVKERMANTREVEEWKRAKDAEATFKKSGQKPLVLPTRRRSKTRNDGRGKAPKSNAGPEDDAGLSKMDDMLTKRTNTQSDSTSENRKERTDRRERPAGSTRGENVASGRSQTPGGSRQTSAQKAGPSTTKGDRAPPRRRRTDSEERR
ncbi:hypothetical protein OCU04_012046 [Sclerotinia nivalis]|uniref:Uncharacterized protein n=1 Tax=Sclerotinia nivalis TaxID=352851 RepID=A0A9X0AA52_9HELO|nr:hypothetical protein OCU04_012046 [Sclerotinia nivalis]